MNRNLFLSAPWNTALSAAILTLGLAVAVQAAPQTLNARQHHSESSTFTLNFGDGPREADISTTQFQLEVDAVAGTARFVNYLQHIDPLSLPGGFTTGNITVEIEPGLETGTYDAATGVFITTDTYLVSFEEDLSLLGLESPVRLESSSSGVVDFGGARFGRIDLGWEGEGLLGQTGITFAYTCEVATVFGIRTVAPAQTTPAEVELRPASAESTIADCSAEADEPAAAEDAEAPTAASPTKEVADE